MVKIGAIILARSNSNRFPYKHLAELHGEPMIYWPITRLKKYVQPYLCTTLDPTDNDLAEYSESIGAKVYRGSEDHILKRVIGCYMTYGLDGALNISGDCPFISEKAIKAISDAMYEHQGYWEYTYAPVIHTLMVEGISCTGSTLPLFLYKLERLPSMLGGLRGAIREDQPSGIDAPELIPGTDQKAQYEVLNNWEPDETPLKTSIDYPVELDFWNIVCGYLGRFPKDYEDIRRALQVIRLNDNP